ncbi:MAG: four helix bundle protein [Deltaproteobacteria bacterium]|nr:MAG: four helix bundle protein [Deltaproteobacteria bacterium]
MPGPNRPCAPSCRLDALRLAEDAAIRLLRAMPRSVRGCGDLGDQARRAAVAVALNLAEGHAARGGNRLQHWRVAHGSCQEVKCALRLLAASGAFSESDARDLLAAFDRIGRMTWGLIRRPGR